MDGNLAVQVENLQAQLRALQEGYPAHYPPRRELVDAVSSSLKLVRLENGLHALAWWFYDENAWHFLAHSGKVERWWDLP